ncbi:hypothetical protein [Variovorax sp. J31P207]|uniref:hypothetical protein n=1 Tax=Variovorax sp. J31P207 TaxID=3053510 RepID=UPI0025755444|nr:hypothetical protein [Variovorax sp. J31P207]MDM0071852.1 hypothetical protein [Variovorax sp. J31P207]
MPELTGTGGDGFAGGITSRQRAHFSISHLLTAAFFSRKVGEIERANAGAELGPFWDEMFSYAVGCVLTSFAGLEAYANEVFIDYADYYPEYQAPVMQDLWKTYERKRAPDKLKFALLLKGITPDTGTSTWENIRCLEALRDALTHFKAEWSDEKAKHAALSKLLVNKAVPGTFLTGYSALFPQLWVSHGTAMWAVRSVVSIIREFEGLLPPPNSKMEFFARQLDDL